MITDPRFAPRRTDLPWLRRRRLPRQVAASAPAAAPAGEAPKLTEFFGGHATRIHHDDPPAPPVAPPTAPPAPVSSSLDLDEPAAPPPRPPAATSSSLDLDEPPAPPPRPPTPASTSSSLDLDEPAAAPARPAVPPARPERRAARPQQRIGQGARLVLNPNRPTVTLTRLQSGIGTLTIEAAVSDEVGDLRLGCAYELADGLQLTMQMAQGNRFAPPHSKRPVLVGSRDRFERVQVDLRQCRALRRLVVYAFSENRQPLHWGGTLVVTTFGGGRIEQPLDVLQSGQIAVLMSIYQVRGELVLRAEMETLFGDVREAARAYGYDRISWLDDRTPVE